MGLLLGVYAFCLVYMTIAQRDFLYFPDKNAIVSHEMAARHGAVFFPVSTADGISLSGYYWAPPSPEAPVIVFFHGNAQDTMFWLTLGEMYSRAGYGFLVAQYRGYGGNQGQPSEQGLYDDARAYLLALQQQGIALPRTVLMGFSLGSGVAVQMALENPSAGLILLAPYSATVDIAAKQYWMFPVRILMWDQFRSADKIGAVPMPLLIVHGEQDDTIPINFAQVLFEKANAPKSFIRLPEAGHNDLFAHGAMEYTVGFLHKLQYPVTGADGDSGE